IGDDGMWGEGTIGYQMFALQALTAVMEVAARQGVDLWGFDHARIKMPFDANFRFAYPDGTAPGINDSGRVNFSDWSGMVYDYAYLRYGDPRYARLVNACPRQIVISTGVYYPTRVFTKLEEPAEIHYPSTVFKDLGYAILRSGGVYALLDYGPHGGPHGHPDKLNFILFAAGDELGGEPRMHRYEDPLHGAWTKATVAHNTLTVDERSQSACTGKLLMFADAGPLKVMRAEASSAYPGVVLDRTLVMTPGAIVDLYRGESTRAHIWDRTFRYEGELDGWVEPAADAASLGDKFGYELLKIAARAPAEKEVVFGWKSKKAVWQVALAGAAGQEAVKALGPDKEQMLVARQKGTRADFGAALRVEGWGGAIASSGFLPAENQGIVAYKMEQDGVETLVVVAHRKGDWTAGNWTSDARVLCAQAKDGVVQRVFIGGGTHAECGGQKLSTTSAQNSYAERVDGVLKIAAADSRP
ncbi:MAG: heparinase II/III family protein, partial [Planctomycetes bacterium]|nr:heparinase II/III family protein [Planctomycetota bacterium]